MGLRALQCRAEADSHSLPANSKEICTSCTNCQRRPRARPRGSRNVRHPPVGPGFFLESFREQARDCHSGSSQGVGLQRQREHGSCSRTRSRRDDPAARPLTARAPHLSQEPASDPGSEASRPDVGLASGSCSRRRRARFSGLEGRSGKGLGAPTRAPDSQRAEFFRKSASLWGEERQETHKSKEKRCLLPTPRAGSMEDHANARA